LNLSGPLQSPRMQLKSNVGEKLSGGLQHALEEELAYRQEQSALARREKLEPQLLKLQGSIAAGEQEILERLTKTASQVERFSNLVEAKLPAELRARAGLSRMAKEPTADVEERK